MLHRSIHLQEGINIIRMQCCVWLHGMLFEGFVTVCHAMLGMDSPQSSLALGIGLLPRVSPPRLQGSWVPPSVEIHPSPCKGPQGGTWSAHDTPLSATHKASACLQRFILLPTRNNNLAYDQHHWELHAKLQHISQAVLWTAMISFQLLMWLWVFTGIMVAVLSVCRGVANLTHQVVKCTTTTTITSHTRWWSVLQQSLRHYWYVLSFEHHNYDYDRTTLVHQRFWLLAVCKYGGDTYLRL